MKPACSPASTATCWPISASPARICATPSPSRSGTTRPHCCASAPSSGASAVKRTAAKDRCGERLPPSAHRPPGAPDPSRRKLHLRNGRALSSAARSGSSDHPLSRPDLSARWPLRRAHSFAAKNFLREDVRKCANMPPGLGVMAVPKPSGRACGLSVIFLGAMWAIAVAGPAQAQSGYDRRGGDYTSFQIRNGDPAVMRLPLRARRALPRLEFLLSAHDLCARHLLAEEQGAAAQRGQMLRVGRARRRRDRAAARPDRIFDRPQRRRLSQYRGCAGCRGRDRARRPATPTTDAAPGPMCGPAISAPTARCYLKDKITRPRHKPCCISGVER